MGPPKIPPSSSFPTLKAVVDVGITAVREVEQSVAPIVAPAIAALSSDGFEGGGAVKGSNVGTLGDKDPAVGPAQKHFDQVKNQKVDWANPGKALDNITQIDNDPSTGNDAVRCGAATLLAGAVLRGPKQFTEGLNKVADRAAGVDAQLQNIVEHTSGEVHDYAAGVLKQLGQAEDTLQQYATMDPKKMTYGDMAKLQDALYVVADVDQRIGANGKTIDPGAKHNYLLTDSIGEYSKMMWGGKAPQMNGKDLQAYWVDNQNNGGHFVLGDAKGAVAYNPWPDADGTAFSRAVDGDGAKLVKGKPGAGELQGKAVNDLPREERTLPPRE